jgi:hypothetical protein
MIDQESAESTSGDCIDCTAGNTCFYANDGECQELQETPAVDPAASTGTPGCADQPGWVDSAGDDCGVYVASGYCCDDALQDCPSGVESTDDAPCCDAPAYAPTDGDFIGQSSRTACCGSCHQTARQCTGNPRDDNEKMTAAMRRVNLLDLVPADYLSDICGWVGSINYCTTLHGVMHVEDLVRECRGLYVIMVILFVGEAHIDCALNSVGAHAKLVATLVRT